MPQILYIRSIYTFVCHLLRKKTCFLCAHLAVFECFILVGLCKLLVKAVCKLACKQVLVAIYARSIAPKARKGFCGFLYIFNGTLQIHLLNNTGLKP